MGVEPTSAGATIRCVNHFTTSTIQTVPGGTRTPDPRLRRPMLYPAELLAHGAGDGNRTHVAGLEGQNSTIELHPQCIKKEVSGWRDSNPRPHGPKPRTLPN